MQSQRFRHRRPALPFAREPSIGDDFGAELRADIDRWTRMIHDAKIPRK